MQGSPMACSALALQRAKQRPVEVSGNAPENRCALLMLAAMLHPLANDEEV